MPAGSEPPVWVTEQVKRKAPAEPEPPLEQEEPVPPEETEAGAVEGDYDPATYTARDDAPAVGAAEHAAQPEPEAAPEPDPEPAPGSESEEPPASDQQEQASDAADSASGTRAARYVKTDAIKDAVNGHETEVVHAIGIAWHGRDHILCPYPDHHDHNPSWRLMESGLAICSGNCPRGSRAHSVFDVVSFIEGVDFEAAKIRVCEIIGREHLIVDPASAQGVTLAQLADEKDLPKEKLRDAGCFDMPRRGKYHDKPPAIGMPYWDRGEDQRAKSRWLRIRTALTGSKRFALRKGDVAKYGALPLYGAWNLIGEPPKYIVLVEGETDCITLWMNGIPALGIPGAPNGWNEKRHATLFDGIEHIVVVVEPGGAGDQLLERLASSCIAPRLRVIYMPRKTKDPNALWCRDPEAFQAAFMALLNAAKPLDPEKHKPSTSGHADARGFERQPDAPPNEVNLFIGSDVEIAQGIAEDLSNASGKPVFDDGWIYRYDGKRWARTTEVEERLAVHRYDGAYYKTAADGDARIQLYKSKIDSILNEARVVMAQPGFFKDAPTGINCASGFIVFDDAGQPTLVEHDRGHGCRHVLPGRWHPGTGAEPPPGSMLHQLIYGPMFKSDLDADKKRDLIAEILGATALGYATKLNHPKCIVLHGVTADNGKSQILDLCRGLVPEDAITSIPPNKFSEPAYLVKLAGKLFNGADELKGSAAIASDVFKAAITGQFITARDLYRSKIDFRPIALHLFATQTLPSFEGGFDRGVLRRLLVLVFTRVIPTEGRIVDIGRRIAEEEADLLLAFAVGGATRLIKQREFTVPPSSEVALRNWSTTADPVLAWVAARVEHAPHPAPRQSLLGIGIKGARAHAAFREWAIPEGYRNEQIPALGNFLQRLQGNKIVPGIKLRHARSGNWLTGLKIHEIDADPSGDVNEEE